MAVGIQFFIVAGLLRWRGLSIRLPQTLSALAGTGFCFGLVSIALISQADPNRNQPILALVWFSVFLWSLVVEAHIYRHALSIAMSMALLLAVTVFGVTLFAIEWLF